MARNKQILIHYHTSTGNVETVKSEVRMGEIVVKHAVNQPALYIKNDNDEIVTFIDSKAIENELSVLKTDLEGQITAADSSAVSALTDFKAEVAKTYATKSGVTVDIATAKSGAITSAASYTDAKVDGAVNTLNNTITGVDNKVTALTATVNTLSGAVDTKFNNYYTSGQTDSAITIAKSGAITSAASYTDATVSAAEGRVNASIENVESKVSKLIGDDGDKSVRTIALDEVSKGVAAVVSGAPEAFDTLKEIADWINAGSGATTADIVTDINVLKKADENLSGAITGVDNKVTALTATVNTLSSAVDTKFNNYYTSGQTDSAITIAKSGAITSAASYTDATVSAAEGRVNTSINGLDSRIDALESLSATTQSAVQTITVNKSEDNKITATKTGTSVAFNFDEMIIDCGEF